MKPTRLYVKEHSVTGLKYFGKTIALDVEKYNGSGKYWKRHISKYGINHVRTVWTSEWFYSKEDINEFALAFSEIFDIVKSDKWANLKEENGCDGGGPGPGLCGNDNPSRRPEVKEKISKALMGHAGVKNKGSTGRPAHNKNKQLWNNGIIQKFFDCYPGNEWRQGELPSAKIKKSLTPRANGVNHHNYGRIKSAKEIEKTREKNRKQYIVIFPDGASQIIHGLVDFCKEHNIDTAGVHRVLNGTQKSYKQYKFERITDGT